MNVTKQQGGVTNRYCAVTNDGNDAKEGTVDAGIKQERAELPLQEAVH